MFGSPGSIFSSNPVMEFIWWMLMFYLFFMVIWMFISVFADIFRRDNLSGWGKAGWVFLLFVFPFLGVLIYMIARPKNTEQDQRMMAEMQAQQARLAGGSSIDDLAKAQGLLEKGAITQAEFDAIKAKALA
jgi:energy-coupling factor transporter transmembrane protein EcfT